MTTIDTNAMGGGQVVSVWDPLVRLIHWGLALAILTNGVLTDADGALHEYVGYAAIGLVGLRLAWGLFGTRHARFSAFLPNPAAALRHLRELREGGGRVHLSHNPLGTLMVYNIWGTVLAMGLTGYMMGTVRFFGYEWVEETHEMLFNWLILSVVLHVGGVVFDTARTGVPLVRAMIDGKKRIPSGQEIE